MLGRLFQDRFGFISRSLRGTEWAQLTDYVTPSFLEVMPLSHLVGQAREMLALTSDRSRFAEARRRLAADLERRGLNISLVDSDPDGPGADLGRLDESMRKQLGETALVVYFAQLFGDGETLLDLRASRFAWRDRDEPITWAPRPLYVKWDPAFRASIRDLYAGYYDGDDRRFDAAFPALHLEPAREVFLSHLGAGDQRAVRFRSEVFHSTFHDAFVRCRDSGRPLHRNFLALGVYLALLYDLLEMLDVELDVRSAYERTMGSDPI